MAWSTVCITDPILSSKLLQNYVGGDGLFDVVSMVVIGLILQILANQINPAQAFQPQPIIPRSLSPGIRPAPSPTWNPGRSSCNPGLEMQKPSQMPQDQYSALPKAQKRELEDPCGRDASVIRDGFPKLEFRYNQIKYKTPRHGALAGIQPGNDGKVENNDQNALILRDHLVKHVKNKDFDCKYGYYQAGTPREVKMIGVHDRSNDQIAVFTMRKDGSYQYLTNCELTTIESKHYDKTGNFTTEPVLKAQSALVSQQNSGTETSNTNTNAND